MMVMVMMFCNNYLSLCRRFSNLKPIDMSAGRGSHHSKPAVDSTSYSQDKAQTNDPSAHV